MKNFLIALFIFFSMSAFAVIDERFPEAPTYMTKASMMRFQYMSHEGNQCTAGNNTKLISRVPYYVYAPAISSTQLKTGKFAAMVFLHGAGEQAPSVLNMCYTRDDAYYASIGTNLLKVEGQAGGPGAAIQGGQFNPNENMVVIIPQSMSKGGFSSDIIRRVIADSAEQLASKGIELDADRIFLTGLSMGGGSVMKYLTANPMHFAAAVPIEAAGGIDSCLVRANHISIWGFAGGAAGNMGASNLLSLINGSSSCLASTIEYKNSAYSCLFNSKSCTLFSSSHPNNLRATFMPNDGHSGWRSVYNGTHSALPTTEKNIYNWMLAQKNSDQGKPLFPVAYTGVASSSAISSRSVSSSSSSIKSVSSSQVSVASSIVASKSSGVSSSSIATSSTSSSVANNTGYIPLSTSMILPGALGNPSALVDEQNVAAPSTYWFAGWAASIYPIEAIIDLGREYTITEITLYDANGTGLVEFSDGDLSHSQSVIVSDQLLSYLKFTSYAVSVKTRYLRVKKFNTAIMSEIKLKGY